MPGAGHPLAFLAPYGGMNTREGAAAIQPIEARYLLNLLPTGSSVKVRPGYASYSTDGDADAVDTLAVWEGSTGTQLIGAANGELWDYSGATASVLTSAGYSSDRWITANYKDYLFGANGADTPWRYDGSSVSATGFTGVTLANIAYISLVRNRLWVALNNSADAYYGGVGSVTGALTLFPLSERAAGSHLMAIGFHSMDAGDGPDDYTVFVFANGRVIVYAGDPSVSFSHVGTYQVGRPIGRDCLVSIGGQLHVITDGGMIPISAAVAGFAFDALKLDAYGKIIPSFRTDADLYNDNAGWQARYWAGLVLIGVPSSAATRHQWVYNTANGAWTLFDYPAAAMVEWNGDLFIGGLSDGVVYRARATVTGDAGAAVELKSKGAFIAPNEGRGVRVTKVRLDMLLEGALTGRFTIDENYLTGIAKSTQDRTLGVATVSTPWGSDWGSQWSASSQLEPTWMAAFARGRSIAFNLSGATSAKVEWFGGHLLTHRSDH